MASGPALARRAGQTVTIAKTAEKRALVLRAIDRYARRALAYVGTPSDSPEQVRAFMLTQEAWHLVRRLLDDSDVMNPNG